jgi:NhaP-type Na+/H+ or K+/H+ antiporter
MILETCTFAYLGLALFSIKLVFQPVFLLWSIILVYISRAVNIFPLSFLVNKCVRNKISLKNQTIMAFSGMRGAVAFALALHMNMEDMKNKQLLLTSTLFVVLFTIIFMGGSAFPLIKILDRLFPNDPHHHEDDDGELLLSHHEHTADSFGSNSRRSMKMVLSKTQEMNVLEHAEF